MMRRWPGLIAATSLVVLIGCSSRSAGPSPPERGIGWANEQIDAQRVVKRRLLLADPIEREVEGHLKQDTRTSSARFALEVRPFYSFSGVSDDAPFVFVCVLTTAGSMDADKATQILRDAFEASGVYATLRDPVSRGDTWAFEGMLVSKARENPDLSVLQSNGSTADDAVNVVPDGGG